MKCKHGDIAPEGIAAWLRWYDTLEPLTMTTAEEAEADAWLRRCDDPGVAAYETGDDR